jgi:hypothetical protein
MRDRSRAAEDFPKTELYMAFDGGSGFDFWLPHVAPHAVEGPNKAVDKLHSSPLKVMNGPTLGASPSNLNRIKWCSALSVVSSGLGAEGLASFRIGARRLALSRDTISAMHRCWVEPCLRMHRLDDQHCI